MAYIMSGYGVLLIFFVLMFLRIPLCFSMAGSALVYLLVEGFPIDVFAHRMVNGGNSYTLLAVPLFIFAGSLMNHSGVSDRLLIFVKCLVGKWRGALAYCNIITSLIFSGITGSALADIGGIGKVVMYAMNEDGYDPKISVGITAASATIGPIFPPSIPVIVFAVAAEVSAARLLMAGIVPALLLTVSLMVIVFYQARKYNFPKSNETYTVQEKIKNTISAIPVLVCPGILIFGLLSGVFGPTELAAFTSLYIFIIGKFIYKGLTVANLIAAVKETIRTTALTMFIIAGASIFAWTLITSQVTMDLANLLMSISTDPTVLLILAAVLLLILGMFMDTTAAILVSTPILLPTLSAAGVDPIHFGVVVVYTLMIGLLTPPVGMSLYMISGVARMPMQNVIKGVSVYYLPLFIVLILILLFPQISLFIPNLIFN